MSFSSISIFSALLDTGNLFIHSAFFTRSVTVVFATITVLSAATGCTIPGFDNLDPTAGSTLGVLKRDPTNTNIQKDGFVKANTVKNNNGQFNKTALANLNVIKISQIDKNNLYLLTREKGLFFSSDGGVIWERRYIFSIASDLKNEQERNQDITNKITKNDNFAARDLTVDPNNKNIIYVAGKDSDKVGKVFQSVDGGNNFKLVYSEVEANVGVAAIAMDPINTLRIYIVLEKGALVRSFDGGQNWQKIQSFNEVPVQFGFIPNLENVFYGLFPTKGLRISRNDGEKWDNVSLKKIASVNTNASQSTNQNTTNTTNNNFANPFNGDSNTTNNTSSTGETYNEYTKLYPVLTGNFDDIKQKQSRGLDSVDWLLIGDKQAWISNKLNDGFRKLPLPLQSEQNNLTDIAYSTSQGSQKLFISVGNKLLESNNQGVGWNVTDKIQIQDKIGSINQIVIDRSNPEIMYLGLGTNRSRNSNSLF
jgi:hypothetical protein